MQGSKAVGVVGVGVEKRTLPPPKTNGIPQGVSPGLPPDLVRYYLQRYGTTAPGFGLKCERRAHA